MKALNGSAKLTIHPERSRRLKRPVKARRRWVINPKTRVEEDGRIYKRPRAKKAIKKIYEKERLET